MWYVTLLFIFVSLQQGCAVECRPGYTSSDGSSCQPCKNNYYGMRCLHLCSCSDDEICDHKLGYVPPKPTYQTTERGEDSKTFVTYTKYVEIHHSTCSTTTGYRSTDWNKGGISHISPLIYIAVTGWSAVFVILCVICRKHVIKLLTSFRLGHRASMSRDETLQSISEPNLQQSRLSFCYIIDK